MTKRCLLVNFLVCALLLFFTAGVFAQDDKGEALIIKGDGVSREMVFSRAELEGMSTGMVQVKYSATNNFPTDKLMYRKGIRLDYLLQKAGIKDDAQLLTCIASDGYARTFTVKELLEEERYCFAADGSKAKVPVMVALADSSKGFDSLDEIEMVLTMGQRVKEEQNNPWFVKYLQTIEVSTASPEQWPPVTFKNIAAGPDDVKIELKHSNFDMVKIYYTTDGSDPYINSDVYNVSASYYQPQLNQPVPVKGNTEIRAVAVGAGKIPSEIASTKITFDEAAVFSDMTGYDWALQAVEELNAQGIINGMGDSRFAPQESLTRAQFATMMILALGEEPYGGSRSTFSDVESKDWYYGYVEKAAEMGLIKGYPEGSFQPQKDLSREEMLTVIVQALGVKPESSTELLAPFASESRISDWARSYVAQAEALGILEHGHMVTEKNNGLFLDARGSSTRAEAAVTVYLMRGK